MLSRQADGQTDSCPPEAAAAHSASLAQVKDIMAPNCRRRRLLKWAIERTNTRMEAATSDVVYFSGL